MHGFQGALFSFLWFYFLFFFIFLFYFIFFVVVFCLISVFWPHPGEPSAFDFSLYGYMVNFLSHSSEMETFKYYIYTFIIFFSLLIMLLVIYCRVWGQTKRVAVTRSLQALWINLWVKRGIVWHCKLHQSWKCLLGLFSIFWVHWGLNLFSAWEKFLAVAGGEELLKISALLP